MARSVDREREAAIIAELSSAKSARQYLMMVENPAWLMNVWSLIHRHPRRVAASVFPREGGVEAIETIGALACARATELTCRTKHDEKGAAVYAQHVALYLEKLPDWTK